MVRKSPKLGFRKPSPVPIAELNSLPRVEINSLQLRLPKKPKPTPTPAWYLVALFGVIIGGIIGYLRVKDKDRNMALTLLLIGILTTGILIMKLMYVF